MITYYLKVNALAKKENINLAKKQTADNAAVCFLN